MDTIYTETRGTTAIIDGKRGTTVGLRYDNLTGGGLVGAFVSWDEGGMAYVTTGAAVGDRGQHREVADVREIDRDEFDVLTGLAEVRRQLGWRE